ncbi:MAG: hypothetical protein ABFD92_07480 [Planctomycetaceae bacterium]|nr:hypothetical protein [Planctomycetaceae bacterium]
MDQTLVRRGIRKLNFWPLLCGPVAVLIIILVTQFAWRFDFYKIGEVANNKYGLVKVTWDYTPHVAGASTKIKTYTLDERLDELGPWLVMIPVALYWVRMIVTRNPLYVVLTLLAASLLMREIHFTGVDKGIYVLGVMVLVLAVAWRDLLARPLKDWRHTSWLLAAVATYALSQIIARRAFKKIPGEDWIHCILEEGMETTAHLMLITASVVASWRRYAVTADPVAELEELPQVPATAAQA